MPLNPAPGPPLGCRSHDATPADGNLRHALGQTPCLLPEDAHVCDLTVGASTLSMIAIYGEKKKNLHGFHSWNIYNEILINVKIIFLM